MKIAIWHNLPSGGGKRAMYDQVRGLLARGHVLEAWCPPTANREYLPLTDLIRETVIPMAEVERTDWDKRLRRPAAVAPMIEALEQHCRECAKQIMAGDFDLLLVHPCMFIHASPIGRLVSLPKVLYLQEPFRPLYEAQPRLPWLAPEPSGSPSFSLARLRERAGDRRVLSNARLQGREELTNVRAFDRVLVNSLFSRESILRAYAVDPEVCYLGTDLEKFVDRGEQRDRMIIGLGSISPAKNIALAIEAVGVLPPPRPPLIWVGNAASPVLLREMAALAASRGVQFSPRVNVTDSELVDLLNRAAVMIYAPRLEPFGLAPIEAGACGVPVVGVAEGGVRETVIDGETGFLVGSSPAAIADKVAVLLDDDALARRLGSAARMNAQRRWSHLAATDRIEQALQRFLGTYGNAHARRVPRR